MKRLVICLFFAFAQSAHSLPDVKQFPEEERDYSPRTDRGFAPYRATSLYGTQKIVLTYDDGPSPELTPQLLNVLKEYDVKATFFVLSERINSRTRPLIERMLREGHIVASHDWNHGNNNSESRLEFRHELKESILLLEEIAAQAQIPWQQKYFRFPYGAYGGAQTYHHMNVIRELGYELYGDNCINFALWDIDTADWVSSMTPENISQTIKAHLFGGHGYTFKAIRNSQGRVIRYVKDEIHIKNPPAGGVVLMHDIHRRTLEATKLFLKEMKNQDIEIVPLSQVDEFSYKGKDCRLRLFN